MTNRDVDPAVHRKDYRHGELDESSADLDPFIQFNAWFAEAQRAVPIEPNAMTLATATKDGTPSARIVLLKSVDAEGFVFYSNYRSRKGGELEENPKAALLFYWAELERQVRIEGTVSRVAATVSDAYFRARPRGAQIGASISSQSSTVTARSDLVAAASVLEEKLAGNPVPRPPNWGGFVLRPERFEFWQGRSDRLHDRLRYERSETAWRISRLAP